MKCTVCQRELAPDLSMCFRCGAMQGDSVREELESSLTPRSVPLMFKQAEQVQAKEEVAAPSTAAPQPVARRSVTADLTRKQTSPTLAEFVTRNAIVPDWRLQLQNSVRQRAGRGSENSAQADAVSASEDRTTTRTSGANALKVDYADNPAKANETDRKVANALKRIENSRRTFLPSEKAREGIRVAKEASKKFPYSVVSRSEDLPELPAKPAGDSATAVRPKLVSSLKIEKKEYDTNKLLPIPEAAKMASSFEQKAEERLELKKNWSERIEIREDDGSIAPEVPFVEEVEPETEEIDDLAPIAMRFNAGLFDMIIGGFATSAVLLPFLAWSEGWFSLSGLLLFASVLLVVMFVYLTASIAYLGQTFGMKIFSLELIDAEQSEFPSLHQAAVSSAVYLFSLILGGLGFLPILFNEERRAAHDILSGTILVRDI